MVIKSHVSPYTVSKTTVKGTRVAKGIGPLALDLKVPGSGRAAARAARFFSHQSENLTNFSSTFHVKIYICDFGMTNRYD